MRVGTIHDSIGVCLMQIKVNPEVEKLVGFMESAFPADSLVGIARAISAIAPHLWGHIVPQRETVIMSTQHRLLTANEIQSDASVFSPGRQCADGDSAAAAETRSQM